MSIKIKFIFFFFFSSRRRHTRFSRDWSSDVCSSDLDRVGRGEQCHVLTLEGGDVRLGAERGYGERGRQPGRGRSTRAGEQLGHEGQLDEPAALTPEGFRHADPGPSVADQPPGELRRVAVIEPPARHLAGRHVGEPGTERLPVGLLLLGQLPPHQRTSLTRDRMSSTASGFSAPDRSPGSVSSTAARIARRMILADLVFGSCPTRTTRAGANGLPTSAATSAVSRADTTPSSPSPPPPSVAPARRTQKAQIASPFVASGIPTTADSATAASVASTASISAGATRLPATFITSSERPRMNQPASSARA